MKDIRKKVLFATFLMKVVVSMVLRKGRKNKK